MNAIFSVKQNQKGDFYFTYRLENDSHLCVSRSYANVYDIHEAISSIRQTANKAMICISENRKYPCYVITKTEHGYFSFSFWDYRGMLLLQSEIFESEIQCIAGIDWLKAKANEASVQEDL